MYARVYRLFPEECASRGRSVLDKRDAERRERNATGWLQDRKEWLRTQGRAIRLGNRGYRQPSVVQEAEASDPDLKRKKHGLQRVCDVHFAEAVSASRIGSCEPRRRVSASRPRWRRTTGAMKLPSARRIRVSLPPLALSTRAFLRVSGP